MPFPKAMTNVNRRVLNPAMRHLAGRVPLMGIVRHRGRTSGRAYQTPVLLFQSGNRLVIALTYGRDVDWVRNIVAAGDVTIHHRGQDLQAIAPVIRTDDTGGIRLPWLVRRILAWADVHEYLHLRLPGGGET